MAAAGAAAGFSGVPGVSRSQRDVLPGGAWVKLAWPGSTARRKQQRPARSPQRVVDGARRGVRMLTPCTFELTPSQREQECVAVITKGVAPHPASMQALWRTPPQSQSALLTSPGAIEGTLSPICPAGWHCTRVTVDHPTVDPRQGQPFRPCYRPYCNNMAPSRADGAGVMTC